jgi:hypothetical protein
MNVFDNWSHSLRRSFVKDYSLPISVVQDPYFVHQVCALERQYKVSEKLESLNCMLSSVKDEESFHKYMRTTREKIIDEVKNKDEYKDFIGDLDLPSLPNVNCNKKIYTQDNVGKALVSIDLVSANFQVFKILFPKLILNSETYGEFASNYTDFEYFKKSKKIRQIIFGNLNPKRQQTVIKHLIHSLLTEFQDLKDWNLVAKSSDEIIFEPLSKNPNIMDKIMDFGKGVKFLGKNIDYKVQPFTLEKLPSSSIYVKRYLDNSFDLKCCPANTTIEALRFLCNEPLQKYDRVFYQDGRVCEFKDNLFNLN